jgi:hypothetical protein
MTPRPSMTLAEAVRTAQAAAQQHHSAHADAVTEEWEYGMHLSVTAAINEHGEPAESRGQEMLQLFNKGFGPSSMPRSATGTGRSYPPGCSSGEVHRRRRVRQDEQGLSLEATGSLDQSMRRTAHRWGPAPIHHRTGRQGRMRHRQRRRAWRVPGSRHDQAGAHEVGQVPGGNPEHRPHPQATHEPDGTFVVVLNKAYGCIESALLWYKVLRGCSRR